MEVTTEPGSLEILVSHEIDAPRDLVFKAFTQPDLLAQWLGPRAYEMKVDHFDARDGGSWRYVHLDDQGNEFGFHGVFHGTPSPDQIVQTFEFEGYPGHVQMDTARFEDLGGGRTVVRMQSVFQSVEDRDGMIASGMERGMREGFERLDELMANMAAGS
jgi:uncharacterized protein YndB with AHSA1/START domain